VVWACIVKANAGLYQPGSPGAPGVAVWSLDPWFDDHLRVLKHVADHVDALRRWAADDDPALRQCIEHARNDWNEQPTCEVPQRLTGGRTVSCGSIWIAPADFPTKVLACRWFPVLCHADVDHVRIVPSQYWTSELVDAWLEATERRAAADWEPYAIPEQRSTWLARTPPSNADVTLDEATDALEQLDFPRAAQLVLRLAMNQEEVGEAHRLLLEIVDRSATSPGLFDGMSDGITQRFGRALVFGRRGRLDMAKLALRGVSGHQQSLVPTWTQWVTSLTPRAT
jgi:hypothetical protein